jgi:hypothetical protein
MIIPTETKGNYKDHRNNSYTLYKMSNNIYRLFENDIYTLIYVLANDQYLIAENTFWDPISGNSFFHIGGINYKSKFNVSFIYSYGEYLPVPETYKISPDLKNFLTEVWKQQTKATIEVSMEKELQSAYYSIYSKSEQNTKEIPSDENSINIINAITKFSHKKIAKVQSKITIPTINNIVNNIEHLHQLCKNDDQKVALAASDGLYNNYYCYFKAEDKKISTTRIILNIAPMEVPDVLNKLWPIIQNSPLVHAIKAGSPLIAAKKLDSIIIYTSNGNELNDLLNIILNAKISTKSLLPYMVKEIVPGIGIADEPEMIDNTPISFGQKRVVLALMACSQVDTLEEMITLTSIYFQQAGISYTEPSQEIRGLPNTKIQAKLLNIINEWNLKN